MLRPRATGFEGGMASEPSFSWEAVHGTASSVMKGLSTERCLEGAIVVAEGSGRGLHRGSVDGSPEALELPSTVRRDVGFRCKSETPRAVLAEVLETAPRAELRCSFSGRACCGPRGGPASGVPSDARRGAAGRRLGNSPSRADGA